MDRPLTAKEAAAELGYSTKHLYRLLGNGKITGERAGLVWLIPRQEVKRVKALQGPGGRLPRGPGKKEP
jgi:excisionase family DNA binding protein